MNNTIKLAVASALLAAASSANAGIMIPAGDWTLDIGGVVNAYYSYNKGESAANSAVGTNTAGALTFGENSAGEDTQTTITTGLLPNYLSVSGKTRQNDLDVGFTISIQPGASSRNSLSSAGQEKMCIRDRFSAGVAEVIKYGLIRDADFFDWLEKNIEKLMTLDEAVLSYAVYRSCQNKADVVAIDEHENGERALLNLGHTFGHAIENAMGYGVWLHGEAVAAGTIMAANLSQSMGWLTNQDFQRIHALLSAANLPLEAPKLGVEKYLDLMQLDKKVADGKIRLVLQQGIGKAVITSDYDVEKLKETLAL